MVIGSQAVLGQHPDAPEAMLVSNEADIYPRSHPERAELVDGAIGELSLFRDTFGYYAHGVAPETAKAPEGWTARLVPVRTASTDGATGWCMELHDLVLAKCVAGREKDWRFASEAIGAGLVARATLVERAQRLPVDAERQRQIVAALSALYDRHR